MSYSLVKFRAMPLSGTAVCALNRYFPDSTSVLTAAVFAESFDCAPAVSPQANAKRRNAFFMVLTALYKIKHLTVAVCLYIC